MNKYIQQSENHITHVDKMVPPHKEHGEWESEFDYKFVTVCPDKKHPLYGKEVLNPIYPDVIKDFIHKLLLSTQQEAAEKIIDKAYNIENEAVVNLVDVIKILTPKETI